MKNKRNKIILISFFSIVFLSLLSSILFYNIPRLEYSYNFEEEGYVVTKYYGSKKQVKIPSFYKDKPIIEIGQRAFMNKNIEEFIFEDDCKITTISKQAFYGCKKMTYFNLPDSVVWVEQNAFAYCKKLENFNTSEKSKLDGISGSMFFEDSSLKNIDLPTSVIRVGSYAFFNCKSLNTLVIPNHCVVESCAFYGCELELFYTNKDFWDVNWNYGAIIK